MTNSKLYNNEFILIYHMGEEKPEQLLWDDLRTWGKYPIKISQRSVESIINNANEPALKYMSSGRELIGEAHYQNHLKLLQQSERKYCGSSRRQRKFFQTLFGEGFEEDHWENMYLRLTQIKDQVIPKSRRTGKFMHLTLG